MESPVPGMQLTRKEIEQRQIETEKKAMAKFRAQKERAYREKQEREEEARRKQAEQDRFARLTRMGLNGLEITEYLELERTFGDDEQGGHDSVRARKRYVRFDRSERKILRKLPVSAERAACFSSEMGFEEARRFMRMPSETRELYRGLKPASRAIFARDLSANECALMHRLQPELRDAFAAMPAEQRHVWTCMRGFTTPAGNLFWEMNEGERVVYMALRKRDLAVNGAAGTSAITADVTEEGDELEQEGQSFAIDHSGFAGVEERDASAGADAERLSFADTYLFMNDAERSLFLSIDEGDRAEMACMPQEQRDMARSLQPWHRAAFFDMGSNDVRANYLAADDTGRAAIMARRGHNMRCSKFEFAATRQVPGGDRGRANAWHVSHLSRNAPASRPFTARASSSHAVLSRTGRGGSRRDCSSRAGHASSVGGSVHCMRLLPESHRSGDARLRQRHQAQKRTEQRRCGQAQLPVSVSKLSLNVAQAQAEVQSQTRPCTTSALFSPSVTSSWHSIPPRAMTSRPSPTGGSTMVMAGGPYAPQNNAKERTPVANTAIDRLWRDMTGGRPVLVDRSRSVRQQAEQHTQALLRGRCSRPVASAKWRALAQNLETCARAGCPSSTGPWGCTLSVESGRTPTLGATSLNPPSVVEEAQGTPFGTDLLRGDLLTPSSPPQELPDASNKAWMSHVDSNRAHAISLVARLPSPKMTKAE